MDALTLQGAVGGTALLLGLSDGSPSLTTEGPGAGGYCTVLLAADWLLPLAGWFAGEARHVSLGDLPGTLYGRRLDVRGDETAFVWNTHTWARLECDLPYGIARVTVGPRAKTHGTSVRLSPEARQDVAAWLRRADAEGRARHGMSA